MQRVSSRQRLVSWDAFDATVKEDSEVDVDVNVTVENDVNLNLNLNINTDLADAKVGDMISPSHQQINTINHSSPVLLQNYTTAQTAHLVLANNTALEVDVNVNVKVKEEEEPEPSSKRKRDHSMANTNSTNYAMLVPSYSWERTHHRPEGKETPPFSLLAEDLILQLFSYLEVCDLQYMSSTNRYFRTFIHGGSQNDTLESEFKLEMESSHIQHHQHQHHSYKPTIWNSHLQQHWPAMRQTLNSSKQRTSTTTPVLYDSYGLSSATTAIDMEMATTMGNFPITVMEHINIPLLLKMTPSQLPSHVDMTLLDHARGNHRHRHHHSNNNINNSDHHSPTIRRRATQQLMMARNTTTTQLVALPDGTIRYIGSVGSGDRCIRGDHPLPRPQRKGEYLHTLWRRHRRRSKQQHQQQQQHAKNTSCFGTTTESVSTDSDSDRSTTTTSTHSPSRNQATTTTTTTTTTLLGSRRRRPKLLSHLLFNAHPHPAEGVHSACQKGSFLNLLRQGARVVSHRGMFETNLPFVAPYIKQNNNSNNNKNNVNNVNTTQHVLDITPRMVAYYEVDIHKLNEEEAEQQHQQHSPTEPRTINGPHATECVAVGIATERFHIHSRMPGWDSLSFGYHGDDGGTFHSSGGMNQAFGPKFGPGDTVGCGIDYVAQGIFFTLNGTFLGYGWKNLPMDLLQQDLYPVVGVDTNAPIFLNMGVDKPFQYDLEEFHQRHAQLIQPQFQFLSPSHPCQMKKNSFF